MPMEVTLSDNAIQRIRVDASGETSGIADEVFKRLPAKIVKGQTLNVDTVAGATISSRGVVDGVAEAITLAGGDAGMRHFMNQFGPALQLPWTYLPAPELSEKLIDDVVEGTTEQLGQHSIAALESYRDDCLLAVMEAVNATRLKHGMTIND